MDIYKACGLKNMVTFKGLSETWLASALCTFLVERKRL